MAKKWKEVAETDTYKTAEPKIKREIEAEYFDNVIAPNVSEGDISGVKKDFYSHVAENRTAKQRPIDTSFVEGKDYRKTKKGIEPIPQPGLGEQFMTGFNAVWPFSMFADQKRPYTASKLKRPAPQLPQQKPPGYSPAFDEFTAGKEQPSSIPGLGFSDVPKGPSDKARRIKKQTEFNDLRQKIKMAPTKEMKQALMGEMKRKQQQGEGVEEGFTHPAELAIDLTLGVGAGLATGYTGKGVRSAVNELASTFTGGVSDVTRGLLKSAKGKLKGGVNPITKEAVPETMELAVKKADDFTNSLEGFKDWIYARDAASLEGYFLKQKFKHLDKDGFEGIVRVQAGDKSYDGVRKYFDDKYSEITKGKIKMGYRENYLPQLWKNDRDEVAKVFSDKLKVTPGFSLERVIKDYKEGIKQGLKPRFQKISDLVSWYEKSANKVLADRKFLKFVTDNKVVVPTKKAPKDWVGINTDKWTDLKKTDVPQRYSAHPDIAKYINNYLAEPPELLGKAANYASNIKNIVLSAGIPKTAWNIHGVNMLNRHVRSAKFKPSDNMLGALAKGAIWMSKPGMAQKYLLKNQDSALRGARNGLTLTTEEHAFDSLSKSWKGFKEELKGAKGPKDKSLTLAKGARGLHEFAFEDPLFKKVIPSFKVQAFKTIEADLAKKFPIEFASKKAAKITNDIFGGLNYAELGKSKEFQSLMRVLVLAPDWASTHYKLGKGILKSLKNPMSPEGAAYRRRAKNILASYVAATVSNKVLSNKWMHENPPGNRFAIRAGSSDGKERYLNPLGTSLDYLRLPIEAVRGIVDGDLNPLAKTVSNRMSIPLGVGTRGLLGVDSFGRKIRGKDEFGHPIPLNEQILSHIGLASELISPQYVSAGLNALAGRSGVEETIAKSFEMPLRYKKKKLSALEKEFYRSMRAAKPKAMKTE